MDLNEIIIFIKVVEQGSFSAAALSLDMPKSTVSAKVSSLEKRLGTTLLRRTTRKLHITDIGKKYYEECQKALSQIQNAEEIVSEGQTIPQGPLRVTAPVELGGALLPLVITEFNKKYPQVVLELILTDRRVDLIAEGVDIGIRTGNLKDSSLISKRLGNIYFAPFASPKYLKNNPSIKTPKDLEKNVSIVFSSLGTQEWNLINGREKQTVKPQRQTVANDLNLIKTLTVSGLGISLLPTFLCYNEVKSGKLVRILKNWQTDVRPVHFIYPSQKFVTPKIKAFIEVATNVLKKNLEIAEL